MKTFDDFKKDIDSGKFDKDFEAISKDEKTSKKTDILLRIAAKYGYDVTVEDLTMESASRRILDIEELNMVTGGGGTKNCKSTQYEKCKSTYNDEPEYALQENCWFSDRCQHVVNDYKVREICKSTVDFLYGNECIINDYCAEAYNEYPGY